MKNLLLFLSLCLLTNIYAQQPDLQQRYESAIAHLNGQLVGERVFNQHIDVHWFPDNSGAWYVHESPDKKEYRKVSLSDLEVSVLFDHERLAEALGELMGEEITASDLPISRLQYESTDEWELWVKGQHLSLHPKTMKLTKIEEEGNSWNRGESESPNGTWTVFPKDHNLFVKPTEGGAEQALTTAGKKDYDYASWYGWGDILEGENADNPEHF